MQQLETFLDEVLDPNIRLRIATRIHFALLRHYGEDVAVSTLLMGEADAREALWVCEASGHGELLALAKQFNTAAHDAAPAAPATRAPRAPLHSVTSPAPAAARGAVAQDLAWSRDTSGFGLSRLPELGHAPPTRPACWLSPSRWLGRGSAR